MSTGAGICAAAGKVCADKAPPRIRNAHRAVHKAFKLHLRYVRFYFGNIGERGLPAEYHTFKPQIAVDAHRFIIDTVRLCAEVERRIREIFAQYGNHSDILNDKGIDGIEFKIICFRQKGLNVLIMKGNIQRTEQLLGFSLFCIMLFQCADSFVFVGKKIICFYS